MPTHDFTGPQDYEPPQINIETIRTVAQREIIETILREDLETENMQKIWFFAKFEVSA